MRNQNTVFFSWLSTATIALLLIVVAVTILALASGTMTTSYEDKSPYQALKSSPQKPLLQKTQQEKTAGELGFSSRYKIETVYPKGDEVQKSTESYRESNPQTKGFFYTEKKGAEEKSTLSPKNISLLFGLITLVLAVFAVSALSVPFVSMLEKKRGEN